MTSPFKFQFRVRYAEVDPQAVVFNSRYLEYADVLVTEYFRDRYAHGMPQDLEFHVRHAEVDYLAPIRLDEMIEGRLSVERIGNSSVSMLISLYGAEDGSHRANINLVQVLVDLETGQSIRIGDEIRKAFGFELAEAIHG